MHPPTYVCTHISIHNIIIKDKIYFYATNNNLFHNFHKKSLLKHRHRDTRDHAKTIDCITHHVFQYITRGRWRMLLEVLMKMLVMTMPLGGGVHQRQFRQWFPPPNYFRQQPSGTMFLLFNLRLHMF
jgi:hypothetical protein